MNTPTLPLSAPFLARVQAEEQAYSGLKLGYRPWLDGLRGLAILAVIAYHSEPQLLARGRIGVDVFFVLSGFLITTLLLEEWKATNGIDFRRFYMRRVLRLFPALVVMLMVASFLMYFTPGVGRHYRSILYSLLYVTNWVMAFNWDHVSSTLYFTWSLAIEEQFYLIWPGALYLALRSGARPRSILLALSAAIILICAYRCLLLSLGADSERAFLASDTRADALLVGCSVGVLAASGLLPRSVRLLRRCTIIMAVIFEAYFLGAGTFEGVGLTLAACFFASVLCLLLVAPPVALMKLLENFFLVWIGKLSYSLYLWHLFANFAIDHLSLGPLLGLVLSIGLSFAIAAASYYFVERPFLVLKRRFSAAQTSL